MIWMTQLTGRMKYCASCQMGLLFAALTMAGLLTPVSANGQTVYEAPLHSFARTGDGNHPNAGLIMDSHGSLYGTTEGGGSVGAGTVFEMVNNAGVYSEKVLYNFQPTVGAPGSPIFQGDGAEPTATLVMDNQKNLYGTTQLGGANGLGTVFELVCMLPNPMPGGPPPGCSYIEQVLYSFSGPDGQRPVAGLVRDIAGNLYGTTTVGGAHGFGTVFELACNATAGQPCNYSEQVLYSFNPHTLKEGGLDDGSDPWGALVLDANGNLFGTTGEGGTGANGTVFELACTAPPPAGGGCPSYSTGDQILYNFTGTGATDDGPEAGLLIDGGGNLYGTALPEAQGGPGYAFELVNNSGTYASKARAISQASEQAPNHLRG